MTRTQRYERLTEHPFYGPMIKKLTAGDRTSISAFIETHGEESADQWTISVREHLMVSDRKNRFLIDDVLTSLR